MRRFQLRSSRDEELVAEGCVFSDGAVAVRWQREGFPNSLVWWNSLEDAERVHTGVGAWRIDFVDAQVLCPPGCTYCAGAQARELRG